MKIGLKISNFSLARRYFLGKIDIFHNENFSHLWFDLISEIRLWL